MNINSNSKPTLQEYLDKLKQIQDANNRRLSQAKSQSNTSKTMTPKPVSQLKQQTKSSTDRSHSTHKLLPFFQNRKVSGSKRQTSQADEPKIPISSQLITKTVEALSPRTTELEDIKKQLNQWFIKESKNNNTGGCLQLLEPTLVHNILKLPPRQKINPELRASLTSKDISDNTALHYAAKNGNAQLTSALIFKQIPIDMPNKDIKTPLILAAIHGQEEVFMILMNAGADINYQDSVGNTCLHYACKNEQKSIVQLLLKRQSIKFKYNKENKTPDSYAVNEEIKQLFRNYNEDFKKQCMIFCIILEQKMNMVQIQNTQNDVILKMFQNKRGQLNSQLQQQQQLTQASAQTPLQIASYSCKNLTNVNKQSSSPNNRTQQDIKQERFNKINSTHSSKQQLTTTISTNSDSIKNKEDDKIGPQQFQVIGLIGKGSFGEVYLVQKSNQLYAMKVLHKNRIMKHNLTRYALTERNVLSITSHPFIVKLRFAFQTQDKLFMILDYCPGGDLGEVLQKQKRLPENIVKNYLCEIVLALEDLHKRDIIFRDLKPDNIVLDSEGHALLTDFGLSKEGILEPSTGARSFCGSVAYLAPEMLKRSGHGKAVDWYLLGVVMYELLVGLPPYYANNREELFYNIENASLKIPSYISLEARNLLKALLQRNPAKRLGSGKGDSEEIKAHQYFYDVDWDIVYNRELPLPKPNRKIRINTHIDGNVFDMQSIVDDSKAHLGGWTFVSNDEL
ncbi:unnamed protein product (macronuclear) [Paramecium tetraurelia]|uniref:Protein kinase domain-containing protein n=1 Tax=Paramecium tetraurelia TaxID=5888 RepID=A0DJL5_PARTE|nr:uncharacterized protein GSPATT00017576001 [Paramecium tetraurelia]CAK83232.1 unnamed protein product [Paramecium tetraurelia]|eukprot:XP_001450629.1 hypothetical protein (macronuclear) [Paramecium tetraurelia strain d4-2]